MKTKFLLLLLIVASALAACSDDPEAPVVEEVPRLNETDSLAIIDLYEEAQLKHCAQGKAWDLTDWHTWRGITIELVDHEWRVTAIDIEITHSCYNCISNNIEKLTCVKSFKYCGNRFSYGGTPDLFYNSNPLETYIIYIPAPEQYLDEYDLPVRPLVFGGIYDSMKNVKETLKNFELHGVWFPELPQDPEFGFYQCKKLEHITLADCRAEGNVPEAMGMFNCIPDLCANYFTSIDWNLFRNQRNVPILWYNMLSGTIPDDVYYGCPHWDSYKNNVNHQSRSGLTAPKR